MEKKSKYVARVYRRPNTNEVEFIGTVNADSIQNLKAKAKQLSISWNKHGGRLLIECQNTQRQWLVNTAPRRDANAKKPQSFKFTSEQLEQFRAFLHNLNKQNWGLWDSSTFLTFDGLPSYSVNQYETDTGVTFTVVKFDAVVQVGSIKDKRFKVGGGRRYQPICPML